VRLFKIPRTVHTGSERVAFVYETITSLQASKPLSP